MRLPRLLVLVAAGAAALAAADAGRATPPPVSFTPPTAYPTAGLPWSVAIGDANEDGKPDLAVTNYGDVIDSEEGTVSVFLGNGDGSFQPQTAFGAGASGGAVAFQLAVSRSSR